MQSSFAQFRRRVVHGVVVAVSLTVSACSTGGDVTGLPSDPATETFAPALGVNIAAMTKKSADLYVQDSIVGTGAEATSGKQVTIQYAGYLANGSRFDTGTIGPFAIGTGVVISGWDQGTIGMRVGGTRRLVIGSNLAYGTTGRGIIPPNATLIFVMTLLAVQ